MRALREIQWQAPVLALHAGRTEISVHIRGHSDLQSLLLALHRPDQQSLAVRRQLSTILRRTHAEHGALALDQGTRGTGGALPGHFAAHADQ